VLPAKTDETAHVRVDVEEKEGLEDRKGGMGWVGEVER